MSAPTPGPWFMDASTRGDGADRKYIIGAYGGFHVADVGMEEDMLPDHVCGNCLGENRVVYDARSGRRLCADCEPNPHRLPLEACVCGEHVDCPDGYHRYAETPCVCTPDCAAEEDEHEGCDCRECYRRVNGTYPRIPQKTPEPRPQMYGVSEQIANDAVRETTG